MYNEIAPACAKLSALEGNFGHVFLTGHAASRKSSLSENHDGLCRDFVLGRLNLRLDTAIEIVLYLECDIGVILLVSLRMLSLLNVKELG